MIPEAYQCTDCDAEFVVMPTDHTYTEPIMFCPYCGSELYNPDEDEEFDDLEDDS